MAGGLSHKIWEGPVLDRAKQFLGVGVAKSGKLNNLLAHQQNILKS
jgi:hypothetical protein